MNSLTEAKTISGFSEVLFPRLEVKTAVVTNKYQLGSNKQLAFEYLLKRHQFFLIFFNLLVYHPSDAVLEEGLQYSLGFSLLFHPLV